MYHVAYFCYFLNTHYFYIIELNDFSQLATYSCRMSKENVSDIYAEVRKHSSSSDAVKTENLTVLNSVEATITAKKEKAISPEQYVQALFASIKKDPKHLRSVCNVLSSDFIVAVPSPNCHSCSSNSYPSFSLQRLYLNVAKSLRTVWRKTRVRFCS